MSKEKKLLWIISFNFLIILAEVLFGIISNSFALIADAMHNAGDVVALLITFIALKLSSRKTSFKYTFGFLKSEMMAAFVNSMFLMLTMLYIMYEAIDRFFSPQPIEAVYMIVVGFIALVANGISAYLLNSMNMAHCHSHEHAHHHEDINIKSAYLHMLSDALISVGVVVAGIFIYFFKIYYIDSVLSIIFSLYIIKHSYPVLKKSFLSLMDINITTISEHTLDEIIHADNRVVEYHDLHIYKPDSQHNFISFHIVLDDSSIALREVEDITSTMKAKLAQEEFNHIIIQVDSKKRIQNNKHCTTLNKVTT